MHYEERAAHAAGKPKETTKQCARRARGASRRERLPRAPMRGDTGEIALGSGAPPPPLFPRRDEGIDVVFTYMQIRRWKWQRGAGRQTLSTLTDHLGTRAHTGNGKVREGGLRRGGKGVDWGKRVLENAENAECRRLRRLRLLSCGLAARTRGCRDAAREHFTSSQFEKGKASRGRQAGRRWVRRVGAVGRRLVTVLQNLNHRRRPASAPPRPALVAAAPACSLDGLAFLRRTGEKCKDGQKTPG